MPRNHRSRSAKCAVVCLSFGRRDIADGFKQAVVIEPGHPFERGQFDGLHRFQGARRWINSVLYRPAQRVEKISSDHAMASATQAQSRNGRRVIRRDASPQIVSINDTANLAELDSHELITLPPTLSSPTSSIAPSIITLSPLDMPTAQFRAGLSRRKENRHLLMEWVRSELVDGVDFGRVHIASKDKCEHARYGRVRECNNPWHWSKPSLFKPGAEKISGMLGMTVHYPSLTAFETAVLSGAPITCVMLRCELHYAHGQVVAEGVGARNLNQDYGDFNKALKMAEKSAHIDATLRLAGLSEVFTQDLEDRPIIEEEVAPPPPQSPKRRRKARRQTQHKEAQGSAQSPLLCRPSLLTPLPRSFRLRQRQPLRKIASWFQRKR
jgi:hypothetical protein